MANAYGNAFVINTPKSDRLLLQMDADRRQKDLYEQRNAQLLDQEFAKNASNIRDVDIPVLNQAWQQYKSLKQGIYKNASKLSNEERIAQQLASQRALSNAYSIIAKSKELKVPEDEIQKGYLKAPDKYDENSANILMGSRSTPVNQHPGLDFLVDGVQLKNQDFTKNVANAVGKQTKVGNGITDNGLTSTPTDYMAYNSPSQFASTLAEGMPDKRTQNRFVGQHSYSDLAAQDLLTKYQALRQTPEFKKAYPNEPEINPEALNDPYAKAVTLTSIDHILRHPPVVIVGKPFNNTDDIRDANNSEWDRRNRITNAQKVKAAALQSQRKDARVKAMLNYDIEDPYEKATKTVKTLNYPNGETKELYDISSLTPTEKEDLLGKGTNGQKYQNYPIELDGKEFLQKGKDGELLNDAGEVIDREQPFINRYKRMGTVKKKQTSGELKKSTGDKPMSLAEKMKAARNK